MPDLGKLDPLVNRLLLRVMIDGRTREFKEVVFERNFIRLVDKAVRAYNAARWAIIAQVEEGKRSAEEMIRDGRALPILAFTDHFEDCITTTNRLLKLLGSIKAAKIKVSREARRSIEAASGDVDGLRNMIEHVADAVAAEEIRDGELIMVGISRDGAGACLGPNTIAFSDLCVVIRRLHEVALVILAQPL